MNQKAACLAAFLFKTGDILCSFKLCAQRYGVVLCKGHPISALDYIAIFVVKYAFHCFEAVLQTVRALWAREVCKQFAAPESDKNKGAVMPKMKTKKSAAKRFRVRPGGTVKRGQAFKRHILTKKTTKNKRHLRGAVNVHDSNLGHMAQMMPFAGL